MTSRQVVQNVDRYEPHLADVLRAARNKRGMTMVQLGKKMRRNCAYVWKYETGQSVPGLAVLTRFADALETTPSALLRSAELREQKEVGRVEQ